MKDYLRKLKLLDHLTTDVEIQKNEFVSQLRKHVDEGGMGIFSDFFDVFSSSKNEFKRQVDYNGFKIKRRRWMFDFNNNLAVATGTYRQDGEKLIIETEINGFTGMMVPFCILLTVAYLVFFSVFLFTGVRYQEGIEFAFPFLFIHAAFMYGIPYFLMRRSTKRLKHELEREFYYMTKK